MMESFSDDGVQSRISEII